MNCDIETVREHYNSDPEREWAMYIGRKPL